MNPDKLKTVIIAGEESAFLRVLSVVLSRTSRILIAFKDETLRELLAVERPALIIIKHEDPVDLFLLNPRRFGFGGQVLLLSNDPEPLTAIELLAADYWLRTPVDMLAIERLISRLDEDEDGAEVTDGGAVVS